MSYLYFLCTGDPNYKQITILDDGSSVETIFSNFQVFLYSSLSVLIVSLFLVWIFYTVLNGNSGYYAKKSFWYLGLFLNISLVFGITYLILRFAYAAGSGMGPFYFDSYLSGIDWKLLLSNALYACLIYFILSLLFKRRPLTTFAMNVPF